MTDNKIKKALDDFEVFLRNRVKDGQPIKLNECDVGILRNISQVCAKAYDEIDRLQTENKNLKVENQSLRSAANSLKMHYEEAQAEIERLKCNGKLESVNITLNALIEMKNSTINNLMKTVDMLETQLKTAKAEAVKEFAERAKRFIIPQKADGYTREIILKSDVDNLVKEMVGENNSDE